MESKFENNWSNSRGMDMGEHGTQCLAPGPTSSSKSKGWLSNFSSWTNWFGFGSREERMPSSGLHQQQFAFVPKHRRYQSQPCGIQLPVSDIYSIKEIGPFKLPSSIGFTPSTTKRSVSASQLNLPQIKKTDAQKNHDAKLKTKPELLPLPCDKINKDSDLAASETPLTVASKSNTHLSRRCNFIVNMYIKCGADFGDTDFEDY